MRDELPRLGQWHRAGETIAVATVIATSNSAPRPPGAALGLHPDGRVVGSVSGGCVEADVTEIAAEVLRTSRPVRRQYGIADADALAVGLTCGGTIEVFVRPVSPAGLNLEDLAARVEDGQPVATATIVEWPEEDEPLGRTLLVTPDDLEGTTGVRRVDEAVAEAARGQLAHGSTGLVHLGREGERRGADVGVFIQSFAPPPRMIVFGATDFAAATASIGSYLGYHVTVCDARAPFTTRARFPQAHEVVVEWPHRYLDATEVDERTVICVLTHDPKFDVPLLEKALATPAAYVGAMGSRRTDADRRQRLLDQGVDPAALERLHSPIGLDLGASTPQETAVSIAAEIVLRQYRGSGRPLRELEGAIHRPRGAEQRVGTT